MTPRVPAHLRRRWYVPRWGTQRRLEALMAIGWPVNELERRLQSAELLRRMRHRDVVEARTAARVARLYEELWNQAPPPSAGVKRALRRAEREGWPRPMEWDDDWLDLAPEELEKVLAAEVEAMEPSDLRACHRARYEQGDRSPLTMAASREYMRRQTARRRANDRRRYHAAREAAKKAAERERLAQAA